jgi:SAM-dependent methyltransferase
VASSPDHGQLIQRACWCGSAHAKVVGEFQLPEGERLNMAQCTGCGVMMLHPQPSDETLARYYSATYYGSSRRKFIGPVAWAVSLFQGGRARLAARYCKVGGRVLDVGCGNGGFLNQMKTRGFDVLGTEWTAESAARVPREFGIQVEIGDLLSLSLPEQSFDLITMWHVFEHLRHPRETLLRAAMLMKPEANLILSLPNAESAQARRFSVNWFHHDPPRHLHGFGPKSLEMLLRQCGFEVISLSTWSLEQNPFGFIQSWLNERGYPRDRLYEVLKGISASTLTQRMTDVSWMGALSGPALALSAIESLRGAGATMTIVARRS